MERVEVVAALDAEACALTGVLLDLSEEEALLDTRCRPWDVAALAVHTVGALHRVAPALDAPAPVRAEVSAAGYYRPDVRFSAEVNEDRVRGAAEAASRRSDAAEMGRVCERTRRELSAQLASIPADRVVLTRHGDAMLLTDFLVTRVVELLVHGLDLADALGRAPWASSQGMALVKGFLLAGADPAAVERSGLSELELVRAATGRELSGRAAGADALHSAGVGFLTLG